LVLNFFGLLVIGGLVGVVLALARPTLRRALVDGVLDVTMVIAVSATLGSLYLSEVVGLVPCELCWFQRIAMYPMALVLVLARIRRDRQVLPYVGLLSVVGLGIALYHVQLQLFPEQSSFCDVVNPCSSKAGEALGWMTIPQMAAICFALIATTAFTSMYFDRKES
jgi:disulfide bond formation protein DsbB